jgi:hypothetical protein
MKQEMLKKLKGALLSKQESKTIIGGYSLFPGGCSMPCCYQLFYPINGCRTNLWIGMTYSYNHPTECVKCS